MALITDKDDELDVREFGLTELPPLRPTLVTLWCEYNQLTSLPPLVSEGNPSTLRMLDCRCNKLTELPPLVSEGNPSTLRALDCTGNALTSLPPLPLALHTLQCNDNPLIYPPPEVLKNDIPFIRKWMEENPPTFVKSALKGV